MLLRYALDLSAEADCIEAAVDKALADGCRTADIARGDSANVLGCKAMTEEVLKRI